MEVGQRKPGNYIAFDGGHGALSALHITEEMCTRLQFDLGSSDEVRVGDHCDLLGGTGDGAVAAILLGRMELKTSQAIDASLKLEPTLSVQPTKNEDERRRNTEAFKAAFTEVLEDAGFTANTPMMDDAAPKTVVWTLSAANLSITQPIRSYRVRSAPGPSWTILEAACASIASPDKFLPVTLGSGHRRVTLVNAIAGYANPTKELLKEAQRVFGDDAEVASIVSLGAGKENALSISGTVGEEALVDALMRTTLDTEKTHEELRGRLHQLSVYFRFNVDRGLEGRMEASSVYERTGAYMQEGRVDQLLDDAVRSIKSRQKGTTLRQINSVAVLEFAMKPRPSLVRNFVGREDILDAMKKTHIENRSPDPGLPAITVLMGLGGSGKTQTALRFALDYEKKYHDASVYFFNASSEAKLKADFELAIRARDSASRSKSHDDALFWFSSRIDQWFIIMDNADDPSVDLFGFIPKSSRGNVIITTRNATYKKLAPNSSHHVEGLSPNDASKLILKGSSYPDNQANRTYALLIGKELGYLPLALAHAAAYISDHQCLSTYLNTYRERRARFLATKPTLPEDYKLSVATTLQMCLDSISATARAVMALLSRLEATSIAHIIIETSARRDFCRIDGQSKDKEPSSQTTEQARVLMATLCPSGKWLECDFNDIVRECLQYSLLQVATQGDVRFYSMHVLVQTYLQSSVYSIQEYQIERLVVRLLGSAITVDCNYKYQAFNRLLTPHLRLAMVDHVTEAGDYLGFGWVLREQGNARLSVEHFEHCVALRGTSLGDKHPSTLGAMGNLALSYRDLGRHQDALELKEKVLELRKRISGDEHPDTLAAMGNLASSYRDLGRHQDALELGEKVLDLRKRISGDEHPETLRVMGNLASSYSDLGRHQDALELGEKVLDLRKRISGDEHPDTLHVMGNLASSYRDLGSHQDALELKEKVLGLRKRISGDEHPDTLAAMGNLASSYRDLGRHQDALELREKVLELQMRISGDEHPNTLHAMGNLVLSYRDVGSHQDALELEEKVLNLRKRISGDEHPDTLRVMGNLASSYSDLGRHQDALELREKVLELQKRISGDEHPNTLHAMGNLASSYRDLGRHQDALELREKVLDLRKRISGDEHPSTLAAMGNLALSYSDLGRHQDALELREKVLELRKRISGDEHPSTLTAMGNLASSYRHLGRHQDALELREKVLDLWKRISGDEHPSTLRAMGNLVLSYRDLGRHQDALELRGKVLDLRKRISGDEHPNTLHAMGNLASSYRDVGSHQDALELEEKVLNLRKRISGDEHPDTLTAMGNLASSYSDLGRHQDALELRGKVLDLRKRISGDEHPSTLTAMGNLALSYRHLGRHREALELQEKVFKMHMQLLGKEHPDALLPAWHLSFTLKKLGKEERAIALLQAAVPLQEKTLGTGHPYTIRMKKMLEDFLYTPSQSDTLLQKVRRVGSKYWVLAILLVLTGMYIQFKL